MYDKGGYSIKNISSPEGGWRTIRKPELEKNVKIFGKKYIHLNYIYKGTAFEGIQTRVNISRGGGLDSWFYYSFSIPHNKSAYQAFLELIITIIFIHRHFISQAGKACPNNILQIL